VKIDKYFSTLLITTLGVIFLGLFTLILITPKMAGASGAFVTTWKTDQNDPGNSKITIPTISAVSYNYYVDWGDGSSNSSVVGDISHTYQTPGTYSVSISGDFPRLYFNGRGDRNKLLSVDSWGSINWDSMAYAFKGCENLQILASDAPDLTNSESLSEMFRGAKSLNSPIGNWDVSKVSSISGMFAGATKFDQDLSSWDTQNIQMFQDTFKRASSFNQNINTWDMRSALSTNAMFAYATSFNQPVNSWDTSRIVDMRGMFYNATSFNQNVNSWNTSSVTRMESVFRNAISFDQDISNWNFAGIKDASLMFSGARLSGINYDKLLNSFASQETNLLVTFDGGSSSYCTAEPARNVLQFVRNWFIHDNGLDLQGCGNLDIRFTNGTGAVLFENEPVNTVVGRLTTVHPSDNTFYYSFCEAGSPDQDLFLIDGDRIISKSVFDFEAPADENKNNVYDLCIRSTDSNGFGFQRLVTVAIGDLDDVQDDSPPKKDDNPQVLGSNSGNNNSNSDGTNSEKENKGSVKGLATTGASIIIGFWAGSVLIGLTILLYKFAHKSSD